MQMRWGYIAALIGASAAHAAAAQDAVVSRLARDSQSPISAQGRQSASGDHIGFVVGTIEYLLVHELAHLVIYEKDVPIVGSVENAADYVAAMALIREEPLDPSQRDRAAKFLRSAASAFAASWDAGATIGSEIPYWGEHALTIQRYYQIACLLYGSNPVEFASVPRATGLPPGRAQACVGEYARATRAIDWLMSTYGRQPNDAPALPTEIVYEHAPTTVSASVVRRLKSLELLEKIVARFHERFTIEQPFKLVLRSCGSSQAAWMPESRELAICYELVDALYLLGFRATPLDEGAAGSRRGAH